MANKGLEKVIEALKANQAMDDGTVEGGRRRLEALASLVAVPADVRCERVDVAGIPAEWVAAPGASDERIILYLHGGSYLYGSLHTHRELVSRLSRAAGARALLIAYRLAPEKPHPCAIEDSTAAYRWLLAQGVLARHIVIAGDSAGGGLTLATLVALRDAGDPMPAAAVCMSPWTDLAATGDSATRLDGVDPMCSRAGLLDGAKLYLAGVEPRTPLASPLYADLHGLPPLLMHVGTVEVLLDDSRRFAARAREAGVDVVLQEWEGMIHVHQAFAAMLPEGQQAIERIGEYIRRRVPVLACIG